MNLQVGLQPFQTPTFVEIVRRPGAKQNGMRELPRIPLTDVDPETLDKLCQDFRDAVFRKAGKEPPSDVDVQYLQELVHWAYRKLHGRTFSSIDDALMLDRMKLYLEHGTI